MYLFLRQKLPLFSSSPITITAMSFVNWDRDFVGFQGSPEGCFDQSNGYPLRDSSSHPGSKNQNERPEILVTVDDEKRVEHSSFDKNFKATYISNELQKSTETLNQFDTLIESTDKFHIKLINHKNTLSKTQSKAEISSASLVSEKVAPHCSYHVLRTIGTGSYGRVHLVQQKASCNYFALKILSKSKILTENQLNHVKHEKEVLSMLQHPFIVKLVDTCQDESNLYMIMEYVPGGELFSLLKKYNVSLVLTLIVN